MRLILVGGDVVGTSSFWADVARGREKRRRSELADRRVEARVASQLHAEQARSVRAETAAQKAIQRQALEAEAGVRTAAVTNHVSDLRSVLKASITESPLTIEALRSCPPPAELDDFDEPAPTWDRYQPTSVGMFGRRRAEAEARQRFDKAFAEYAQRRDAHRSELEQQVSAVQLAYERRVDGLVARLQERDPAAVADFAAAVIGAVSPLHGLVTAVDGLYDADPAELVIEIELPGREVVPAERAWRYVHARQAVEPLPRPSKEAGPIYAELVAQIALAVLNGCFQAFTADLLDSVVLNGHVRSVDPATGQPIRPCLVSVTTNRSSFDELVLGDLDPTACLRHLGAELSKHPFALEAVAPFIDFELKKYRIVTTAEALTVLDPRADLLQMDPYEFERLVKELFIAMGYETWRTTSSRDEGIDAIATKMDPIMPVECIIQAKRFRGLVPPKEVQALIGALTESGTATHGVLVTTSWLSDRSRQRARRARITPIERNELAYLIQQHLGREVVISNKPPPTTDTNREGQGSLRGPR